MLDGDIVDGSKASDVVVRLAPGAGDLANAGKSMYTSLDKKVPAELALLVRCMESGDKCTDDVLNQVLNIEHILANNIEKLNKATGELEPGTRIVLITEEGTTIGTTSKGIYRSLQSIISLIGTPPFRPAIQVRIKNSPTKSGYSCLILEFLGFKLSVEETTKKKVK